MTTTEIQTEITRLVEVVRYSQKKESDDAAREIMRLKRKLEEQKCE